MSDLHAVPELPYGGHSDPNSGYSGSDTSADRAHREDEQGITGARQRRVINLLANRRQYGITWREAAQALNEHHGAVSGALSVLHKTGHIVRLAEKRDRCKVYVLDVYVNGRPTEEPGRNSRNELLDDMATMLRRLRDTGMMPASYQITDLLERYGRGR